MQNILPRGEKPCPRIFVLQDPAVAHAFGRALLRDLALGSAQEGFSRRDLRKLHPRFVASLHPAGSCGSGRWPIPAANVPDPRRFPLPAFPTPFGPVDRITGALVP